MCLRASIRLHVPPQLSALQAGCLQCIQTYMWALSKTCWSTELRWCNTSIRQRCNCVTQSHRPLRLKRKTPVLCFEAHLLWKNKQLSYRRWTTRGAVSVNLKPYEISHKCSSKCILIAMQWTNDLQGHSRSMEMARIDRPYDTSYAATTCLSFTISEISYYHFHAVRDYL